MSPEPHSSPGRSRAWRVATPLVVLVSGTIFGVSAQQSDGLDLRGGRLTDLASVVRAQRDEAGTLTAQVAELNSEVEALSAGLGDRSVARVQGEVATLTDPAGLTEKAGRAVQVTLDDASFEAREAYPGEPNDLVVHQQDIQAVANAMWNAGAVAVTIQGQRLISTTGIKCSGSQVTINGLSYSPPYVIMGIGDPARMQAELTVDPMLAAYRDDTFIEGGGVSWDMTELESAVAPAYEGLLDLTYATPIPG
ncbi:DUF881 domain-containing protein [Nocardioides KLBMP 9356]|uniref:DUF881 domain-containing protein n=1 Tax=Nocardioides potassii TaxID=2911371 RepID=A0ABS9HE91_9ACTN|nr:DUF881 domain-containing protein [Nocardioides potassii]MCF6378426.1 DUF881 domain-containing protein [Nocardioides potassii]